MSPREAGTGQLPTGGAITDGLATGGVTVEEVTVEEVTAEEVTAEEVTAEQVTDASEVTVGIRFSNLTLLLLLAQALTGVVLLFHYRQTVSTAYFDIVDLHEVSKFGFARGLHLWGSYAAIIIVWLHLVRTAMRGVSGSSYRRRRWFRAVALMLVILAFATTGTLLPWDAKAYWGLAELAAVSATARETSSDIAASQTIDGDTLSSFYVVHCFVLPLLAIGSLAIAGWRKSS